MDFNATNFWDVLLWSLFLFIWISYIFVWVRCLFDMFGDPGLGGFAKAIWAIFFIFFGPITTLIYLIVRGKSMQQRSIDNFENAKAQQDRYIQQVAAAGKSPAEQIAEAKGLLDSGAINQQEFAAIKAKALA
ncbi:MAG: SHOCT domain-containing protein [Candidatus Nanopelagicales bacterium]